MTTFLRAGTGPLTAERSTSNDAAAQPILMRFADYIGATGTNQQRLQAIVDWCWRRVQEGAAQQAMSEALEARRESIRAANKLD